MKNTVKQMLGTPTPNYTFTSPGGRVNRETYTYTINHEKKIVVETYRRQGKKRVEIVGYVHNPMTVVYMGNGGRIAQFEEWEPVITLKDNSHDKIDLMLAQVYGVVNCMIK